MVWLECSDRRSYLPVSEGGSFPEGECGRTKTGSKIDAISKGQHHSWKMRIPFALRLVLYHFAEEFYQRFIDTLNPPVSLRKYRVITTRLT